MRRPIVLVRHHAPAIAPGICYGRLDVAALAGEVPRLRRATVWSSPSRRCLSLARAVAARHRRRPRVDARLLEVDFAAWEGVAWADISRERLDGWARAPLGRGAPGGESGAGLIRRIRSLTRLLLARPGPHIVIAHAGPLALLARLLVGRRADLLAPRLAFGEVRFVKPRGSAPEPAKGEPLEPGVWGLSPQRGPGAEPLAFTSRGRSYP